MEKSKINILLIIVSFIVGMLIMLGISFITKEKCEVCEKCPSTNDTTKNEGELHVLDEDERKIFNDFNAMGIDLYKNGKYKEYPDEEEGVYAVTYKDLNELGYDMSKYSNCEQDIKIIYFDPNNVLASKYMGDPIQINIICNYPQ